MMDYSHQGTRSSVAIVQLLRSHQPELAPADSQDFDGSLRNGGFFCPHGGYKCGDQQNSIHVLGVKVLYSPFLVVTMRSLIEMEGWRGQGDSSHEGSCRVLCCNRMMMVDHPETGVYRSEKNETNEKDSHSETGVFRKSGHSVNGFYQSGRMFVERIARLGDEPRHQKGLNIG